MEYVILALGGLFILALWDAARRYIESARFNTEALELVKQIEQDAARTHDQVQAILSKLNAAQAAQASRMPRIGRSS